MANMGNSLFGLMVGAVALWLVLQFLIFVPVEAMVGKPGAAILFYGIGIAVVFRGLVGVRLGDAMIGALIILATFVNTQV